ncbi:hypothetical protein ACLKA7_000822 [Drosophila subpalustris]
MAPEQGLWREIFKEEEKRVVRIITDRITMGVHWISYRRKSELQAILKEFGLDTEGTVEEMRSRLSSFASQRELPKAVTQRLAELESTLGCTPTPDPKTRPRSPTPGENQPGTGPAGASTSMEATSRTAAQALTNTDISLQVPPRVQTTGNTAPTSTPSIEGRRGVRRQTRTTKCRPVGTAVAQLGVLLADRREARPAGPPGARGTADHEPEPSRPPTHGSPGHQAR